MPLIKIKAEIIDLQVNALQFSIRRLKPYWRNILGEKAFYMYNKEADITGAKAKEDKLDLV